MSEQSSTELVPSPNESRLAQIEHMLAQLAATAIGNAPAASSPSAALAVSGPQAHPPAGETPPVSHTDVVIAALTAEGDMPKSMETLINDDGTTITLGQRNVYFHCIDGKVAWCPVQWFG